MNIFRPADILLPENTDMNAWSVVACDQFTSEPDYWAEVYKIVGDKPSTLRMILPEAELSVKDPEVESDRIFSTMESYLRGGVFKELSDSYVFVERKLNSGVTRRGIIGMIDLETYDWKEGTATPIRATEHTVEDRLPPRVKVREKASLEMPHIMIFIDDPDNFVMDAVEKGEKLYDFELMQNGGHICGWKIEDNAKLDGAFRKLCDDDELINKYGSSLNPIIFAVGDGNHSIAAAKKLWNSVKESLSDAERLSHPARYALTEIVNIHDEAISFEPIHRVLFGTNNDKFLEEAEQYFEDCIGEGREVCFISGSEKKVLNIGKLTIGQLIEKCDLFCSDFMAKYGGTVDYIHGDAECVSMASADGCAGILLPKMEKSELFTSVYSSGPFPKKSFSIGHGPDKRYYLECRAIKSCQIK